MTHREHAWAATCLLLTLFTTGCPAPLTHPAPGAPTLVPSYTEVGDKLHWTASGKPFYIAFFPTTPCDPHDNLASDGKSGVVCNVTTAGVFSYDIIYGPPKQEQQMLTAPGEYPMHVAPCIACRVVKPLPPGHKPALTFTSDVELYCVGSTPTAYQPDTKGSYVKFHYQGLAVPDGAVPFDVKIDPGVCAEYENGTTIQSPAAAGCTVLKSFTYHFDVYGCTDSSLSKYTGKITLPE